MKGEENAAKVRVFLITITISFLLCLVMANILYLFGCPADISMSGFYGWFGGCIIIVSIGSLRI